MLQLNLTPFPVLETERLLLRRVTMDDINEVFFLRSDVQIMKYIDRVPCADLEETATFIKRIDDEIDNNRMVQWGITLKENPSKIIGTICYLRIRFEDYRPEVGYALYPSFWKKGIMKEVLLKVIDYGFNTLGIHSISANINPDNAASAALLESTGFVREAYFKEDYYFNGKFLDSVIYSRLSEPLFGKI